MKDNCEISKYYNILMFSNFLTQIFNFIYFFEILLKHKSVNSQKIIIFWCFQIPKNIFSVNFKNIKPIHNYFRRKTKIE
jgi:hypothetical protein